MIIKAYITTYNRPDLLKSCYDRFKQFNIEPTIYDDYTEPRPLYPDIIRHNHRGKKGFWKTWDDILKHAKDNEADLYIFTVDDFVNLDIEGVIKRHTKFNRNGAYVHNIINDKRNDRCWTRIKPVKLNYNLWRIGWTDCAFFCNREALDRIGYYMHSPGENWFNMKKGISSGVGMMLTKRLNEARVSIYKPEYSLAYHGDHESQMHKEHRKTKKLISR